jgi:colanic acid/amylovoran biosynthesis glycosyltransferase
MLRVAHIRDTYLRQTETFIYDIYTRHSTCEGYFFCERLANREQFPAKNIYSIENGGRLASGAQSLIRRLTGHIPFYTARCREHGIGLIHAHFAPSGYYTLATKKELGIPLIVSFYGQDVFEIPSEQKWKVRYLRLFNEADLILSLSKDMTADLLQMGCPEKKIKIYRLGIDLTDFSPVDRPERELVTILTIARLVEKKGIEYLIRAAAELVGADLPVRLKIIGDGPLMESLTALARELSLGDRVDFAGRVPFARLPEELAQADIFCLPSVTDRFGGKDEISMVLKEAMGTAMPIVATYHAGIPEVISDGVNGLLVPERDAPALTAALKRLAEDPGMRAGIGKEGRKLVEEVWEIGRQVRLIESIYHETAGNTHDAS